MIANLFDAKSISYNLCENVLQYNLFPNMSTSPHIYQSYVMGEYLKRYEELFDLELIIKNAGIWNESILKTPQIVVFQDPFYSIQKFFMDIGVFFGKSEHYGAYIELQRRTAKQAVKTVAVSNFMKRDMERNDIKCDIVIPEGVDTEMFKPSDDKDRLKRMHKIPTDKKIGIAVTKFIHQKGWTILSELVNKFPDIHWIIILTEKIGASPKLKNVTLIEEVPFQGMPRMYNCADFFINTSPVESFGLSAIESASCGLPIIVYKTGFSWDWWDDRLGVRVDNWEVKDFENAINSLVSKEGYDPRKVIIERGFTLERMAEEWKDLAKKIINKK